VARPVGAKNKISKTKVYDELIRRNFNVLDEVVALFRSAGDDGTRAGLLKMLMEYCFAKRKPEDAEGESSDPGAAVALTLTNDQLDYLLNKAKERG
jgi:hypothetical protein